MLFVCVGTPQGDDGKADLTQVESIARLVARNLNGYKLIVEKSTVPAITAQWVKKTISAVCPSRRPLEWNGEERKAQKYPGRNAAFRRSFQS